MRIGLHVSIAGNICESLERAKAVGCDAMQIFSRNPRGWQPATFTKADAARFRDMKKGYGIRPVVVHIPYLVNLASPDKALYRKSIDAFVTDLARADMLDAEYFVTHLGSHVGSGEEAGVRRFYEALNIVIKRARPRTMILLENTAGSGSWIGYKFEHIKTILESLDDARNVGVCLDTAHTFEAGYDIRTPVGFRRTMETIERLVGLKRVKVIHFNDSLSPMGSCVDRHQHLGKGNIGSAALGRIINFPAFKDAAFIMETPKESEKDEIRNMKVARKLVKRPSLRGPRTK